MYESAFAMPIRMAEMKFFSNQFKAPGSDVRILIN